MAVMPLFGFGRYMPDGIFISCTFNYIEQDLNNLIYVLLLIFTNVIGELREMKIQHFVGIYLLHFFAAGVNPGFFLRE